MTSQFVYVFLSHAINFHSFHISTCNNIKIEREKRKIHRKRELLSFWNEMEMKFMKGKYQYKLLMLVIFSLARISIVSIIFNFIRSGHKKLKLLVRKFVNFFIEKRKKKKIVCVIKIFFICRSEKWKMSLIMRQL